MSSAGFVKLHRVLAEASLNDLNPVYFKVAIHLILMANWKPKERTFKGTSFLIDRGQVASSLDAITLTCGKGIKIGQVRRAIDALGKVGFLRVEPTSKFTYLTILNYCTYQDIDAADRQQNGNRTATERQQNGNRTAPIEEGKKVRRKEGKTPSEASAPDSESPVSSSKGKAKAKTEVDPGRFDKAYEFYPRKVGKTKGLKLAREKITTEAEFKIFGKAMVQLDRDWAGTTQEQRKYLPHFDTFIRNDRWKEELPTPSGASEQTKISKQSRPKPAAQPERKRGQSAEEWALEMKGISSTERTDRA